MHDARRSALRWAAATLLLSVGAAAAQPPVTPGPAASPAAPDRLDAPGASAARNPNTSGASRPRAPAPAVPTVADLAARPALEGLQGGGEAAPLCRAQCAPAFYTCVSGSTGEGGCHPALAVCRRGCDAVEPPPGRLQSPLPAAGLAPAGALRPLPGGLPPLH